MSQSSSTRTVRGRWLTALLCASVLATSTPVRSQGTADELARRHFDSGAAYLHESDYESALKEFQKAYELSKRAEILLNIATVHERTGDLQAAIGALNEYLAAEPSGEHAETVKLRIQNLTKRQQAKQADAGPPPPEVADAGAPEAAPPPATATAPPPPAAPPPEEESNIAAYVALGVGGLAALGAGVTGYLAESEYSDAEDSCSPNCTDDDLSSGRTYAWTSTILTGVAVVGVGVGLTLLLTGGGEEEAPAAAGNAPELLVGFGPQGALANATWRF